jgi:hypothetical protein
MWYVIPLDFAENEFVDEVIDFDRAPRGRREAIADSRAEAIEFLRVRFIRLRMMTSAVNARTLGMARLR